MVETTAGPAQARAAMVPYAVTMAVERAAATTAREAVVEADTPAVETHPGAEVRLTMAAIPAMVGKVRVPTGISLHSCLLTLMSTAEASI